MRHKLICRFVRPRSYHENQQLSSLVPSLLFSWHPLRLLNIFESALFDLLCDNLLFPVVVWAPPTHTHTSFGGLYYVTMLSVESLEDLRLSRTKRTVI